MKFPFLILILAVLVQSCRYSKNEFVDTITGKNQAGKIKSTLPPAVTSDTINIAAVGDIMLGTSYRDNSTLPPDSAKFAFTLVEEHLKNADVTFGNLEGTLLDTGKPANYKLHFRSKGYLFRSPVKYAAILKNVGFDVLSIANNHIDDFGLAGRLSTMEALDRAGLHYAGLVSHSSTMFTIRGIKYGFCAFAPNSQTPSLLDLRRAATIIKELKQVCDIVIVSFHGGGEGPAFEHVTCERESYFGENRGNASAFAHNAIDNGADLILGHGPHVSRAMELYNGRLIAYSLGNFCTYRGVSIDGVCGIAPLLKVRLNRRGQFLSAQIVSVKQSHLTGLQIDKGHRAAKKVKLLTETDFPQSGLTISETGTVTRANAAPAVL